MPRRSDSSFRCGLDIRFSGDVAMQIALMASQGLTFQVDGKVCVRIDSALMCEQSSGAGFTRIVAVGRAKMSRLLSFCIATCATAMLLFNTTRWLEVLFSHQFGRVYMEQPEAQRRGALVTEYQSNKSYCAKACPRVAKRSDVREKTRATWVHA